MTISRCTDRAEIYLAAAKSIDSRSDSFACCAIGNPGDSARLEFQKHFQPMAGDSVDPNPYRNGWYGEWNDKHARAARVIALCFMAAMVEAGDA